MTKSLGQIAYEAHEAAVGPRTQEFASLHMRHQQAWQAAAEAVAGDVLVRMEMWMRHPSTAPWPHTDKGKPDDEAEK